MTYDDFGLVTKVAVVVWLVLWVDNGVRLYVTVVEGDTGEGLEGVGELDGLEAVGTGAET